MGHLGQPMFQAWHYLTILSLFPAWQSRRVVVKVFTTPWYTYIHIYIYIYIYRRNGEGHFLLKVIQELNFSNTLLHSEIIFALYANFRVLGSIGHIPGRYKTLASIWMQGDCFWRLPRRMLFGHWYKKIWYKNI